jgi:hypothetical protein
MIAEFLSAIPCRWNNPHPNPSPEGEGLDAVEAQKLLEQSHEYVLREAPSRACGLNIPKGDLR